jgi:tetrahydromethanopterin S-methyltransferase subunit F
MAVAREPHGRVGRRAALMSARRAGARSAAAAAVVLAGVLVVALSAAPAGPAVADGLSDKGPLSPASANERASGFEASIGLTRSQVEARFHEIDGGHTVFQAASDVKGVPRVLGRDQRLYTIVEVNGFPEVVDVQVVSVLDTGSKTTLENQVVYDSLVCALFGDRRAQSWCTGRILNTNSHGLVTATASANYAPVRITVKTYQSSKASSPPVVSLNIAAV